MSSSGSSSRRPFRFKTDLEKGVLLRNFEKRGWVRSSASWSGLSAAAASSIGGGGGGSSGFGGGASDSGSGSDSDDVSSREYVGGNEDDWNFYWASVHTIRSYIFGANNGGFRLNDFQKVNHFPNHYELTRKDNMIKNFKRARRDYPDWGLQLLEFVPVTYILPADYSLFVEEYNRHGGGVWIMKPASRSQGAGIFIISKLSQIRRWAKDRWEPSGPDGSGFSYDGSPYVVSRYIENPLLVGGRKFDVRMYALVVSYRPLKVYMYSRGFARLCAAKYSMTSASLDDPVVHLTNVAVQKKGAEYNQRHGGKFPLKNLRMWLEATRGREATQRLFDLIDFIVVHSLRACQNVVAQDKHCFECYGYDIMIDATLKPWLLEVNASPSLSCNTRKDRVMKTALINDILNVVIPPDFLEKGLGRDAHYANDPTLSGAFRLICDESVGFDSTCYTGWASTGMEPAASERICHP